jgi:hypothetical protein
MAPWPVPPYCEWFVSYSEIGAKRASRKLADRRIATVKWPSDLRAGFYLPSAERVDQPKGLVAEPEITHGNHPRFSRLYRIFQCLAVPRQPLKLLETLEMRVLKRLASAVQLRPWPPSIQSLTKTPQLNLVPFCPKQFRLAGVCLKQFPSRHRRWSTRKQSGLCVGGKRK